ncbi:MAG: MFS transporter [Prevotellaceae bacterium]|jgi:fucose permease|nr:MFS transporter [Prevotellaceae bacterium]
MSKTFSISKILPVLFGFFIMGFCDLVGISTSFAAAEYELSDPVANFLPSMVFLWFLIFSIPTGVLMNKLGRKRTVTMSMVITLAAMLLLVIPNSAVICYLSFALLGIGNTILQVSLNPLLTNVVRGDKLASSLTAGQFIKALSSFCGPIIAGWAAVSMGSWHYMFPIFAAITVLSTLWLMLTPIEEELQMGKATSFGAAFGLLRNSTMLLFFLGILFVVGVDVGMNTATPKVLVERCGLAISEAGWGTSMYFLFRTAGAFVGAFVLAKFSEKKFFVISMIAAVLAMLDLLLFAQNQIHILSMVAVIGFSMANIFSIIFSLALRHVPGKANEVSGLMVMGVSGGAIIPPIMGFLTNVLGSQSGSMLTILACMAYLLVCSLVVRGRKMKKCISMELP